MCHKSSLDVSAKNGKRIVLNVTHRDHICSSKTATGCTGGAVVAQPSQAPTSHSEREDLAEPVFPEMTDTDNTGRTLLRGGSFVAGNALLFAAFSFLWVKQYHMAPGVSDTIDYLVVPWLWLAGFFAVSFWAIRRPLGYAILVSLGSAAALSGILFLFVHLVLVPFFDPMF